MRNSTKGAANAHLLCNASEMQLVRTRAANQMRSILYPSAMGKDTTVHIRFDDEQLRHLEKLQAKLHLERSSVIRLAVARMVEAEGILRNRTSSDR